jgi:hypothetical protein
MGAGMGRSTGIRRPAAAAFFAVLALLAVPAAASAATAVQFSLATPATATAGVQLTGIQITARDSGNAIDTTYNGPVSLTSNDPAATLTPNPVTLTNGVGTFNATLNTPGCRRITAFDGSISGSSPQIAVNGCDVIDAQNNKNLTGATTQTGHVAVPSPGGASQCGSTKSPTLNPATGSFAYDAYTYTNLTNGPVCISVDLDPGGPSCAGKLFNVSYVGLFDPANPLTDYAGDPDIASPEGGTVTTESFTVPAGASFTNVVHSLVATPGAGSTCSGYFYSTSSSKPFAGSLPSAVGTAAVGSTLGWDTGFWFGNPSFSYQWRRCDTAGANCSDIPGATNGTYDPTQADVGSTLRIRVAATDGLGTSTADSPPTAVVAPGPTFTEIAPSQPTPHHKKKHCKKRKHKAAAAKKCKKKRKG